MNNTIINNYHIKAVDCVNTDDYENAIQYYEQILELIEIPNNKIKYLSELANIYKKQNKYKEALSKCYLQLNTITPNDYILLNEIGMCYFNLNNYKMAIKFFRKIIEQIDISDVHNNIGNSYVKLKEYDTAKKHFIHSNKLNNNYISSSSLGELYYYEKNYTKSIHYYNSIKNIANDNLYNSAFPYLASGNFKIGFKLYENRLASNNINIQTGLKDRVDIPYLQYWNGIDKCNRLLVVYEQGIGDNIQFFRFIYELSKKHKHLKIDYFGKDVVNRLFVETDNIKCINNVEFFDNDKKMIYNYYAYIMSLPYLLNVTTISPNTIQYIKTYPEKTLYWKTKLDSLKKYKVGFVYNGLLSSFIEKNIPLPLFETLCDLDIELICIHKKSEIENDLNTCSFSNKIHTYDLDIDVPFEDTIHLLQNIDLLITIDTSIVHLAGILGIKTWLLLGYSEWRWSNVENKTYWYNSVELIRTNKDERELKNIIPRVKSKLYKLLQTHAKINLLR